MKLAMSVAIKEILNATLFIIRIISLVTSVNTVKLVELRSSCYRLVYRGISVHNQQSVKPSILINNIKTLALQLVSS